MPDLRQPIKSALSALAAGPLRDAAKNLLKTLGYQSDRTLNLEGSKPQAFLDLIASQGGQNKFDESKALCPDWKSADILFQLSDSDISRERSLFKDTTIQPGLLQSYLFFAIELKGKDYARGKLAGIARQINRVFPMPVMLLIRHGDTTGAPVLSIAVINRRRNKVHAEKDVLEKVTLIRDVSLTDPHRGHLDILASFAVENLVHPKKLPIQDFDTLHAAWEQIFNIELLNARFYKELANWYFWALPQVEFPADLEPDDEKRRATGLIRLLTRLIFCWFLKEKNLIPEKLFHPTDLAKLLKGFDPESETSSTYYQAILQNLFFATLNQRMGKDGNGKPYRLFATDEGFAKNRATYDVNNLYRYEKLFAGSQDDALAHFADIPFLNGGLFECLDRTEESGTGVPAGDPSKPTFKKRYLDGFSRNAKKRPHVPDRLFFDSGETADLSTAYGDTKRKAEKVTGLITILNRYKFTIVENTPIDQEIALDPELLGKVFENLLASYNEETKTTARKQTGSFYTPRPIVDYMVDESLKAHLERKLTTESTENTEQENQNSLSVNSVQSVVKKSSFSTIRQKLDHLFAYTEDVPDFSEQEKATLIAAIDALKILDPACGSGAFPMGVLHKLVYLLSKLDERNEKWRDIQVSRVQAAIEAAEKIDDATIRDSAIAGLRKQITDILSSFADNELDYGRKLYLIENCLYGVDIQPIAIQITKLRFFISLVCDQKTNKDKAKNHGIRPLPNLETKFVAANSLIGIPQKVVKEGHFDLTTDAIQHLQKQLQNVRHQYFTVQFRRDKLKLQREDKELRQKLAHELARSYAEKSDADTVEKLALWDPFDPQATAGFFDTGWMFGRSLKDGFDIVIGNPPYGAALSAENIEYFRKTYKINTTETAILFIERGLNLLKNRAYHIYIIPKSFSFASNYEATRALLLSDIKCLVDCGKAFENVKIETCIIGTEKGTLSNEYQSLRYEGDYSFSILGNINKSLVSKFGFMPNGLKSAEIALGNRIRDTSRLLGEISSNSRGEMLQKELKDSGAYKVIGGKEIDRYGIRGTKGYLDRKSLISEKAKIHVSSVLAQNIVAHITKPHDHIKIIACLPAATDILVVDTINQISLTNSSFQREFIWCLFSSTLINWYCYLFILAKAIRTIHFDNSFTARIPVPNLSPEAQQPYIQIAKDIYKLKASDSNSNVAHLEDQLNALFYKCYGLTPEEIAIVEGTAP